VSTSTMQIAFSSVLIMVPFVLVVVVARFMGPVFIYLFQKFQTFLFRFIV